MGIDTNLILISFNIFLTVDNNSKFYIYNNSNIDIFKFDNFFAFVLTNFAFLNLPCSEQKRKNKCLANVL